MTYYSALPTAEDHVDNERGPTQQKSTLSPAPTPQTSTHESEFDAEEQRRGGRPVIGSTTTTSSSASPHEDRPLRRPETQRLSTRWSSASTIFGVDTESLQYSFSPARHNEKHPLDTARPFIYMRQLGRLARLTIGEWLITTFFCGMMALVLRVYERRDQLDLSERHWFNAATTLIALLLGINLAASLRSYAKLLRWRLLSYTYRPLRTFDLVLGCDSLINVCELVWKARNDSDLCFLLPSWTQVLGVLWLATNLTMTLFVGMIGLNYNLDSVMVSDLTAAGYAYVPDLASTLENSYYRSLDFLQARGAGAFDVRFYALSSIDHNNTQRAGRYGRLNNGTTQYWLYAYDKDYETSAVSRVFIRNDVACSQHDVTDGQLGMQNWFVYTNSDGKPVNMTYPGLAVGPRGMLAMSNMNSTCGDRCTEINMFTSGVDTTRFDAPVTDAYFYKCNSTMSAVSQLSLDGNEVTEPENLQLPDEVSRILAGSIGWSPYPFLQSPSDNFTYQSYSNYSNVFFHPDPDDCDWSGEIKCPTLLQQLQNLVSCFNMGSIVAACANGYQALSYHELWLDDAPRQSLTLTVEWPWTIALLAGIPFGQLVALIIVLLLANNTIIRDDSHLAISKIYFSLLKKYDLGERGCMLHTDELVNLMDTKVAYTWRDLPERHHNGEPVAHADVYEQPLYRFKIKSGRKTLRTRPEYSRFPVDKYYD